MIVLIYMLGVCAGIASLSVGYWWLVLHTEKEIDPEDYWLPMHVVPAPATPDELKPNECAIFRVVDGKPAGPPLPDMPDPDRLIVL